MKDVGINEQEFMKACMSPSVQKNVEMQVSFEGEAFTGLDFSSEYFCNSPRMRYPDHARPNLTMTVKSDRSGSMWGLRYVLQVSIAGA